MNITEKLSYKFGPRLPIVLQTESAECGLACLVMIANHFGYNTELRELRNRFPPSLKGATLKGLMQIAEQLHLATRPLKLELSHVRNLKLPCILHWNFNHFVVLKAVYSKFLIIHDPAHGERKILWPDIDRSFTGVALEIWPSTDFSPKQSKNRLPLRNLIGKIIGLRTSCIHVLLLALILEFFAIISPFYLQWVMDNVIVSSDRDLLTTLSIGFILLLIMQQVVSTTRAWALIFLSTSLNLQWRANVFSHLIRLPIQYFERRHLGDILSRFNSIDTIQRSLTTSFLESIIDGVMATITLTVMLFYSLKLAALAITTILVYALIRSVWYGALRSATEEQIIYAARQQSHFLETIRGIKAIKLFGREDERRANWLGLLVNQINADIIGQKLSLAYKATNGFLFGLENILIIWFGAQLVLDGNFTVGALLAFNSYKSQFDSRLSSLIDRFFDLKMLQMQGERLADILFTKPEQNTLLTQHSSAINPTIQVKGLRYCYSQHDAFVLDGVDFEVAAGESLAIVGPSGCGKSTLVNVLLGLLPPTEGQILFGGVSMDRLGTGEIRKFVGTVLQDDALFAGSISDNITFFDPNPDRKWMKECAEIAAIAADIDKMPMGYNTLIGDMGTILSGGQKQRVLLARALYKKPCILFLDEATSHLDVCSERAVSDAVKALKITRIIVAHRPETIASADRAILLIDGKIASSVPLNFQPKTDSRLQTDNTFSV